MSNDLLVSIVCPGFSENPRICLPLDLDEARDGHIRVEWSGQMAAMAVEALVEVLAAHILSDAA